MNEKLTDLGEFGLIARLTAGLADGDESVVVGVGDDCAVLDDGGDRLLLITTDLMAEGVHFLPRTDPVALGDKLLSVNLSDVAAMGGTPRHAVLAVAVPAGLEVAYLDGVYAGLRRRARRHGVSVVGGDTTRSGAGLVLSLTLTGRARRGGVLTRSGARPGDAILVSGTLGDSGAGLALSTAVGDAGALGTLPGLAQADRDVLRARHDTPEPRVDLGRMLPRFEGVHAAIDLSDGLASDLGHICRRSEVGARIDLSLLPLSGALLRFAAETGWDPRSLAASAGEDYELCVAVDPGASSTLVAEARALGIGLTEVGRMADGHSDIQWTDGNGHPVDPPSGGWDHFG